MFLCLGQESPVSPRLLALLGPAMTLTIVACVIVCAIPGCRVIMTTFSTLLPLRSPSSLYTTARRPGVVAPLANFHLLQPLLLGEKKPVMPMWRLLRLETVLRRLQPTSDLFKQQLKDVEEDLDQKSKLGELE